MNKVKHTMGPWEIQKETLPKLFIASRNGFWTNMIQVSLCLERKEEARANARLVAMAPELLDALVLILPLAKGYAAKNNVGSNQKYIEIAEQAIAKVEGTNARNNSNGL